ncbi:MAG: Gfo/Idh/MocA family protein [Cellulosilyticaceae bacterium]
MKKVTIGVIGAGERGQHSYAKYLLENPGTGQVVAVAEPVAEKRERLVKDHGIEEAYVFESWEDFLEQDKMCDAVFICTNDDMHYEPAEKALKKGYHVLLEKPMANTVEEIRKFDKLAKKYTDQVFAICHVLRYTPFFGKIKEVIESGVIGELVNIQHNENVGYHHIVHSYVRGNWRNSNETSPIILAKSCHDLDILVYLVGGKAKSISSFGSLKHFKASCAPEGASERCVTCQVEAACPYSAKRIYTRSLGTWPTCVFYEGTSEEELLQVLGESNYGKCVYHSDNNVADHQVTIIEFENEVTATFNLSGFTHDISRTLKVMGTRGEIRAHMEKNCVDVHDFLTGEMVSHDTSNYELSRYSHGGGDAKIIQEFVETVAGYKEGSRELVKTSAIYSVESHLMGFAAEESRLTKQVIEMDEYRTRG